MGGGLDDDLAIREKESDPSVVEVIDQTLLPHRFERIELSAFRDYVAAIEGMVVRGAGLIGVAAAYAMHAAALEAPDELFDESVDAAARVLVRARPTASNLAWAVRRQLAAMERGGDPARKRELALEGARAIRDFDTASCREIGRYGCALLERIAAAKAASRGAAAGPVNVLTHCNAGGLAFADRGTATAPVYEAAERGLSVHVWVDETRPRNQGASLTAWELGRRGIPHSLVVDNAGGHLMRRGLVDIVLVGADRVSRRGDVANKIGTYLKALAAFDSGVPFYAALPSSTIDWDIVDGEREIPIEERSPAEVEYVEGLLEPGSEAGTGRRTARVRICPASTQARNFGFDVTPARLVTGLITERGICRADEASILGLFPEMGAPRARASRAP
jgi:methylthioribose-1-phosphate isomerase